MSYTIEEAKTVMAETARILKQDERLRKSGQVNARAAATSPPPAADDVFFTYVAELMDAEGISRAAAIARVAAKRPDLHAAWISQYNKTRRAREASNRKADARNRRSRNS